MKAFLGMGLLGSNFVKAVLRRGETVQVWNRTTAKAQAVEPFGAKAFEDVSEAVHGADVIHLTLKDDAAVDEVLQRAGKGFKSGATIIDHTTTSAKGAIERTKAWKAKGFTYLHAPVFMGPQNALESTGVMLVSGDQVVISKFEPELSAMTGKLVNFGPEAGKAAGIKLTGNLFLLSLTTGLSDALALAKAHDITNEELLDLFNAWNPGASVTPVFMGPQNALESTGVMLVSGDQVVISKFEPELSAMTGKLVNFGPEAGKAAGIKLTGNLFLLSLTTGLSDALALAKAHDITNEELLDLFNAWNPGASVPARLKNITSGKFDQPSWELNMARKDAGLMIKAAKEVGINLTLIGSIAALMDEHIAKGHGNDDWSVIAKENI